MNTFIGGFTGYEVTQQLQACIGCQECLLACPVLEEPILVGELNAQTYYGGKALTFPVARFAQACTQCGACVSVCPIGLRRDAMMMWLKVRLQTDVSRWEQQQEGVGRRKQKSKKVVRSGHVREKRGAWRIVQLLFA